MSGWRDEGNVACYSVGPGRIALYDMPVHWITKGRNTSGGERSENPKEDVLAAAMRARKRCSDAAGWLFLKSRGHYVRHNGEPFYFRQGFWTLTCPEPVPEAKAREALSLWWNWARKVHGVKSYLWVAELTERGRVHFHAIVNQYMHVDAGRAAWLRCLKTAGCVSDDVVELPTGAVTAGRAKGSESGRLYAAKYIGKAFGGKRAEQLQYRLDLELEKEGGPDPERVEELQARLAEAMANVRAGVRRWSATQDLSRKVPALNAMEAGVTMAAIRREMDQLKGRWGKKTEHGQTFYFELSKMDRRRSPILHRLLSEAAVA